eukprot:72849_1
MLANDEISADEPNEQAPLQGSGQTDVIKPRNSMFTDDQWIYVENIRVCCEDYDGLDIFQLMAINTDKGIKTRFMSLFEAVKCFLCAATQLFGIFVLLTDFVGTGLEKKGGDWLDVCDTGQELDGRNEEEIAYHLNLRILSFLFSSFLAMISIDHLNHIEKGLYYKMRYAMNIKWVNSLWLRFGLSINIVVSIVA